MIIYLILALVFGSPGNSSTDSTEAKVSPFGFRISLIATGDSLDINCVEGCTWKMLSFNRMELQEKVKLNQYGANEGMKLMSAKVPGIADFQFNLQVSEGMLVLKGEEGVLWSQLKRPLVRDQIVFLNRYGFSVD